MMAKPEDKHLLLNISKLKLSDCLSDSVTLSFLVLRCMASCPETLEHSQILYTRRNILYDAADAKECIMYHGHHVGRLTFAN